MHKKGPVTQLVEEKEKLEKEKEEWRKRYIRLYAEFDNYRKRKEKEMEEYRKFALEDFMREITVVLENYDRAMMRKEIDADNKNFIKGIEMIFSQLKGILEKYGLKEFSCIGEEFDPARAEAIGFVETNDTPPNIVVDEARKGYMLYDKIIKPALVTVTKPKGGESNG